MDWSVVLTSSVVAALITLGGSFVLERIKKEDDSRRRVYGPLKIYLTIVDAIDDQVLVIKESGKKAIREAENVDSEKRDRQKHVHSILESQMRLHNEETKKWWFYIDKIFEVLLNNPDIIKKKHYEIIGQFIRVYEHRECLGKEERKNIHPLLEDNIDDDDKDIVEVVNRLKNIIL